jgi:hypothetical protein
VYYRYLSAPDQFNQGQVDPPDAEGFYFGSVIVDNDSPSSSFARFYSENRERWGLPRLDLGKVSKGLIVGLILLFLGVLALHRRRRSLRAALLVVIVAMLDLEFLLPHRWPYVDIHWLVPLALSVPLFRSPRPVPQAALLCVLAGLVLGNSLALVTHPYTITLARTYLLAGGLTALAWWGWCRQRSRPVGHPVPSSTAPASAGPR